MNYETAYSVIRKLNEASLDVISSSLMKLSKEELEKIPIIDAHTKIVAEKYATCFSHSFPHNYNEWYGMYLISTCLFRDERPTTQK